jgi:serine/threonine-protein kinase
MATLQRPPAADGIVTDLLPVLARSGILSPGEVEGVKTRVRRGEYPRDPVALADRLARENVLTVYQAVRLLKNRPEGLVVGRYLLLEKIGAGGMGRVYKARHLMMGRTVALKFVSTRHSASGTRLERFRREMHLVGRLDHPNVVRAYDADRVGDALYLVLEYVPGRTLDDLLTARGKLPAAEAVYYVAQAALGLDHAHRRGVVHRDVKPSNLLLSDSGRVKVLDLGLGVLLEREESDGFKTETGIAVGTMEYLSPEQACLKPVDGRSDIYSLGCVLYHLISGRLPFGGDSSMERLAARIAGPTAPIAETIPGLHPGVAQAIEKMMARRPEDRFQTAAEVAEALRHLIRHRADPSKPAPTQTPPPATDPATGPDPAPDPEFSSASALRPVPLRPWSPGGQYLLP